MLMYIDFPSWIKPEIVSFLPIRWYAVMYIVAFFITYLVFRHELNKEGDLSISKDDQESLFLWMIVFLLLFARLFSVFFYSNGLYYLTHPHLIFWPFEGGTFVGLPGMSYHGGALGAFLGGYIFCKRKKLPFFRIADLVVLGIPLGYTFGRIGNFINMELYGKVSALPFAVVFPDAPLFSTTHSWVREIADNLGIEYKVGELINLPRHPSQLYEALFEGVVLFFVLLLLYRYVIKRKSKADGSLLSFYLIGYGIARFFIEYCRQPDVDIGYVLEFGKKSSNIALFESFLSFSKGQVFCFIMIIGGIVLYILCNKGILYDNK